MTHFLPALRHHQQIWLKCKWITAGRCPARCLRWRHRVSALLTCFRAEDFTVLSLIFSCIVVCRPPSSVLSLLQASATVTPLSVFHPKCPCAIVVGWLTEALIVQRASAVRRANEGDSQTVFTSISLVIPNSRRHSILILCRIVGGWEVGKVQCVDTNGCLPNDTERREGEGQEDDDGGGKETRRQSGMTLFSPHHPGPTHPHPIYK